MDRPLSDWQHRLRGVPHTALLSMWAQSAQSKTSYLQQPNFHLAAAERMRRLAHMAIDLADDERIDLLARGEAILQSLVDTHRHDERFMRQLGDVKAENDRYFDRFGTKTARTYMYDQGLIDLVGDRT
ncbi:MAG: hypothetical protein AAFO77_04000 [Pseudomonadota bacterium]